jgi:hypothetical protein
MAEATGRYDCKRCGASFGVRVIGLDEPSAFVSDSHRRLLRDARARHQLAAERAGQPLATGTDPVAEVEQNLLESFGAKVLVYATCPACGARNPEGVALVRGEARRTRWGTSVFFGLVALSSAFWPVASLALPVVWTVILALSVVTRRRQGHATRWTDLLAGTAVIFASASLVFFAPRAAFGVPLVFASWMAIAPRRAGADDEPFERARASLVFERAPFREPARDRDV